MTVTLKTSDDALIRKSDVERWKVERERLLKDMEGIKRQVQEIEDKLSAVELITGEKVITAGLAAGGVDEPSPMIEAAEIILRDAGRLMSNKEIMAALRESDPEFRRRLDSNPNYFYTMMSRLVTRKKTAEKVGTKYRWVPKE